MDQRVQNNMKNVNIGDTIWYKIKSDDIRTGKVALRAPNVNGKEMFKPNNSDFWFTKEQLFETYEEASKK